MKKTKSTFSRALAATDGASALLMAGAAQAALQDRDLDGDTVVDAFYDTDLDITWFRNADVNGWMDWNGAMAWVAGFNFAGYDDWRLPTSDQCVGVCAGGEMSHLWYVELGNSAGAMTNTGSFLNLQTYAYWSGSEYVANPVAALIFDTGTGQQRVYGKGAALYAMAVRPGDVAMVPELETYALLPAGLTGLALARRRRMG